MSVNSLDAANAIIDELTGRSGLDDLWDSLDPDIQSEIVNEIAGIIESQFGEFLPPY